jgi:hypothetical protein
MHRTEFLYNQVQLGAAGENRTLMSLRSQVFETCVSTNSTTTAQIISYNVFIKLNKKPIIVNFKNSKFEALNSK